MALPVLAVLACPAVVGRVRDGHQVHLLLLLAEASGQGRALLVVHPLVAGRGLGHLRGCAMQVLSQRAALSKSLLTGTSSAY
jgi:hypothetical protein